MIGITPPTLSTDFGQAEHPSSIEGSSYYLGKIRALGLSDDEVHAMTHDNGKKLVQRERNDRRLCQYSNLALYSS